MTSSVFCIVIPLMVMTPKGKWYTRDDRYECFSSQSICFAKLAEKQKYLTLFQNSREVPKPYCKLDNNSIDKDEGDDKMSPTGNELSPVKKSWYKFW